MYHRLALAGLVCLGAAFCQEAPPAQAPASQNPTEMVTKDEPATFRSRVNLVMVPVVVRDKTGRAVGGLSKEDFQLFDRGKLQVITRFTAEKPGGKSDKGTAPKVTDKNVTPGAPLVMPERYIAYLFDDIHLNFGDMVRLRDAARKHLEGLRAVDRAAIYTTSGQTVQDFTDDRDALHSTLARLQPRPLQSRPGTECPDLNYYIADMIQNHNDPMALQGAVAEVVACMHLTLPQDAQTAESMAKAAASRVVAMGAHETKLTLGVLRDAVRRISVAPGQRILILASPGFITPENHLDKTEVMDRAIRGNVMISAIDARGLWTDPMLDASRATYSLEAQRIKSQYERENARMQADVLAELAAGTGGTFFQNNNDLEEGFQRVAAAPDYYYLLGFSPQNLKLDGTFHALKVSIKSAGGLGLMARKGYYAPKQLTDAAEQAKQEITEALFSREELRELPIDMHSQFFKPSAESARVTVLVHVDLKNLRFRKADGRNNNNLTIVAALFDRNGNYVTGVQKLLEMKLKDETLTMRADPGITLRNTFDVKPGTYLVRLVVRDSEGQQMSAQNGAIEIP